MCKIKLGSEMWDHFTGQRVDLKSLSESLKQFFEDKSLIARVEEESTKGYRITAVPRRTATFHDTINVSIQGKSDDFKIEFVAGSNSSVFMRLGGLVTLLGGGSFVKKELDSSDASEKLEREFWTFVDMKIEYLKTEKLES